LQDTKLARISQLLLPAPCLRECTGNAVLLDKIEDQRRISPDGFCNSDQCLFIEPNCH
jgi:hypothetical protein